MTLRDRPKTVNNFFFFIYNAKDLSSVETLFCVGYPLGARLLDQPLVNANDHFDKV